MLEAIREEQLSDEQLMQLTMLEQMPRKSVRKPSKSNEKAVRQDFHQDEEAQAILQSIISNAQQLQGETIELAPADDGSEVGYLSQEVINEILAATPKMDETLELAIALPVEVWTFAVRIFVAVINRYRSGSEHGLLGTVLEEIYRSAYIDRIGKIFLWDQMKENARSAYDVNPANVDPHDDFHGGALFLDLLKRYVDHKGPFELNLIGHSAGCIHISHFVKRAAEVLGEKNPVKNIIFWAPAVNFDTFVECFVRHREMVENLCIFTMSDEAERADRLMKNAPFLYPHSLLYLVSGLFESKPDGPILGLALHLQGERHDSDPNVKAGRDYVDSFGDGGIKLSPSEDAHFISHGGDTGPDQDTRTLTSTAVLVRTPPIEVVSTLEVVPTHKPKGEKSMSASERKAKIERIQTVYQQEKAEERRRWVTSRMPQAAGDDETSLELFSGDGPHTPVSNQDSDPAIESASPEFGKEGPPTGESIEVVLDGEVNESAEATSSDELLLDAYWASYGDAATRALVRSQTEGASILEVVIGADDRTEIVKTREYPWRCICSLKITAADGSSWIGTAWFVSPRVLLTAGHCVYIHDRGGWVKRIEVIPGRRGSERPYGSAVAVNFHSVTGWTKNQQREYDYAAIMLPDNRRFGSDVGWFGYTAKRDELLNGLRINISGYPGDKPTGTQWFHANTVTDVDPRVITYDTDTAGGQSGAPVWIVQSNKRLAVGIHTNGALTGNSATRITPEMFNNINNWKNLAD